MSNMEIGITILVWAAVLMLFLYFRAMQRRAEHNPAAEDKTPPPAKPLH